MTKSSLKDSSNSLFPLRWSHDQTQLDLLLCFLIFIRQVKEYPKLGYFLFKSFLSSYGQLKHSEAHKMQHIALQAQGKCC